MTFPAFIHFHDFLRFCWCSWLFEILFIFMTFPVFIHFHDFLRYCSINDFPCFPWFCSFMTFWDFSCFIHFHDFLRFCSFSWLFEILFMSMTFEILFIFMTFLRFCSFSWLSLFFYIFVTFWDFVHVHEILFMFTPLYKMTGKCEPKSCSVVHPKKIKIKIFHSCSFNLCCVKRCGTEGENLKERDFFKCFFLMTLPI